MIYTYSNKINVNFIMYRICKTSDTVRGVNSGWPGPVRPKPAKPVNI